MRDLDGIARTIDIDERLRLEPEDARAEHIILRARRSLRSLAQRLAGRRGIAAAPQLVADHRIDTGQRGCPVERERACTQLLEPRAQVRLAQLLERIRTRDIE